ncbi:polar amino acid transport system permease protein [Evansella vedderi]|uniref:Polar amino acid transport system permease protein n=1 Tax=Evansella vedderi TaxID=38282 RepID=A0ABT9ZQY6_9BACI|nr:amino acid ABC transporter permease [Evansella vedderi]MDQ0253284.1 polar amino acid transport system permease protein [Evansella vedderi]
MNIDFSRIEPYIPFMLEGIWVTLLFTLLSLIFGLIWGTCLTLMKISTIKPLRWFADFYTSIFRGTPLLLQLFIIYFSTPQLLQYDISPLMAGVLAFGLNSSAYISEIMRAGINAIDKGQREAAMSLGVNYSTMMLFVILPQAFKNILPALVNEMITLLKESSLVSVIGVQELLRRANIVTSQIYVTFEPLIFTGIIYYVIVMILAILARLLERRMRVSEA